jgi:hypothetical protein
LLKNHYGLRTLQGYEHMLLIGKKSIKGITEDY